MVKIGLFKKGKYANYQNSNNQYGDEVDGQNDEVPRLKLRGLVVKLFPAGHCSFPELGVAQNGN